MEFDDPEVSGPLRARTARLTRGAWQEQEHFRDVVTGFAEYAKDAEREIRRREAAVRPVDLALLPSLRSRPATMRALAKVNQKVLDFVCEPYFDHIQAHARDKNITADWLFSPAHRMSKVRVTLHQIAREWSAEGATERAAAFEPLLQALVARVPKPARVAVPGCGLGRLVVETSGLGYRAEGSEFSYEMLITGDWIMNRMETTQTVHPWFDQASNVQSFGSTARPVVFPDRFAHEIIASDESGAGALAIVAGEFAHIYASLPEERRFAAVLSCFFIDTAPNLNLYLDTIRGMLLPGGLLISFGPLQWHWQPPYGADARSVDDVRFAQSQELTLEDVLALLEARGFDVLQKDMHPGVRYNDNHASMQHNSFDCALIVAKKRD